MVHFGRSLRKWATPLSETVVPATSTVVRLGNPSKPSSPASVTLVSQKLTWRNPHMDRACSHPTLPCEPVNVQRLPPGFAPVQYKLIAPPSRRAVQSSRPAPATPP